MSADNWAICPQCKVNNERIEAKRIKDTEDSYGKVSMEEFEKRREALRKPVKVNLETLREDFQIGIDDDGKFYASYSGGCDECGFSFKFKHEEQRKIK